MNKRLKSIIIGLTSLVVLLLIFLPKIFSSGESSQTMQNPGRMNLEIPVTAHIVSFEKLGNIVYTTGTILSNEEVELRSEISGKIVQIMFREGAYVSKRDLLVKINDA